MKKHFLSLIDTPHRKWTFSLIHPWRKPSYYLILSGICFGIIVLIIAGISVYALIFIKPGSGQTQGATGDFLEGFAILSTFFFCAPGIIAGLSGAVIRAVQKKPQDN